MNTKTLDRTATEVRGDIRGWIRCVRSCRSDVHPDICGAAEYADRVKRVWKYRHTGWSHG